MKKSTIIILSALLVVLLSIIALAAEQYYRLAVCNVESRDGESHLIYVYPGTTADSLFELIEQQYVVHSPANWRLHSRLLKWNTIKTGAYTINAKEGDLDVIRRLRNGEQTPVDVSFKNVRTVGSLATAIAGQLMLDSADIAYRLKDSSYMAQFGLDTLNAIALFMPNTYEMFWNVSADKLFSKMAATYNNFWNSTRRDKARQLGLTPAEVTTLASIVEGETFRDNEKPIVAGLYLNRLHRGMKLQADPTVIFAHQDFTIRRLMRYHLDIDSPYNTYRYAGLPPGPIRTPYPASIDAVLNYQHHNYIYMCANADFSYTHKFAASYSEHLKNARDYQRALNAKGIK